MTRLVTQEAMKQDVVRLSEQSLEIRSLGSVVGHDLRRGLDNHARVGGQVGLGQPSGQRHQVSAHVREQRLDRGRVQERIGEPLRELGLDDRSARNHDVVALAVQLDDLELEVLAFEVGGVAHRAHVHLIADPGDVTRHDWVTVPILAHELAGSLGPEAATTRDSRQARWGPLLAMMLDGRVHIPPDPEFNDLRDDLRRLDWNIYARHERPFIKLMEDEEDLAVYVVLDGSAAFVRRASHS